MSMRIFCACILVLGCVACQRSETPAQATDQGKPLAAEVTEVASKVKVTSTWPSARLLEAADIPSNTAELFARLTPEDRAQAEAFFRNYPGSVLEFDRPEMLQWMVRHGFPMPEDIVAAAALTDQELEARYKQGDIKAGYFLLDRVAAANADGVPDLDAVLFANELLARGDVFAGYAYYRYNRRLTKTSTGWADALAGLMWAQYLGDDRLDYEIGDMINKPSPPGFEDTSPAAVISVYQGLLTRMSMTNPALMTGKKDPLILYRDQGR